MNLNVYREQKAVDKEQKQKGTAHNQDGGGGGNYTFRNCHYNK